MRYLLTLALLLIAGQAQGSYWFQVVDISPIEMAQGTEANFTVSVRGLGSQGEYVQLVFRNLSDGFSVSCPRMIKYVFPAGVTQYNCTIRAGSVAPGNYSFVVDVAARGSPSGKRTGYIEILEPRAEEAPVAQPSAEQRALPPSDQAMPSFGAPSASIALLLAARGIWLRLRA